jgi:hypothetical protein
VENTPSFENKIREVAGTAELVVEDGSAVIAKVNVYDDSTYLPLTGNNAGDQAFATDTDILYIWDGSAWQQAGAANSDDLTEGSTNLFFTDARADARAQLKVDALVDAAPGTLDTLNELAAALGDDPNFATTVTNSIATKLPLAGGTLTGNVNFGDNDKAIFGAGSDLEIYYDGTDGYIRNHVGGRIITRARTDLLFQTNATGGGADDAMKLLQNGAVELYWDNYKKFETTSTGIDVTGTVTSDGLTVTGTNGNYTIAANGNDFYYSRNGTNYHIANTANGGFQFLTGSSSLEALRITSAQNVNIAGGKLAIGTTGTPTSHLDIRGSGDIDMMSKIINTQQTTNGRKTEFLFGKDNGANLSGVLKYVYDGTQANRRIDLVHYGTSNGLSILDGGNVGIGTTSPDRALTIEGSDFSSSSIRLKRTGGGSSNDAGLQFESAAGANADTGLGGIWFQNSLDGNAYALIRARTDDSTGTSGRLDFMTSTSLVNNSSSPSLTIKSSGNVGIGTTTPEKTLHVKYDGSGGVKFESTQWNIVDINSDSDDNGSNDDTILRFTNGSNNAVRGEIRFDESSNTFELGHGDNQNHIAIASDGNVGIGDTNPLYKLSVNNGTSDGGIFRLYNEEVGLNVAIDGTTGSPNYTNASRTVTFNATRFDAGTSPKLRLGGQGGLEFAADANNVRMVITNGGNVGINVDSPSERLEVDGGIKISNSNSRLYFGAEGGGSYRALEGNTGGSLLQVGEGYTNIVLQGNVGIGTTSPDLTLDVSHGTGSEYVATFQNTADNLQLLLGTTTGGLLNIQGKTISNNAAYQIALQAEGGNVGIGTTNAQAKLHVDGTIYADDGQTVKSVTTVGTGVSGVPRQRFFRHISTGAGQEKFVLMRYARHWWGVGFFEIIIRGTYYGSNSKYGVFTINGHTRSGLASISSHINNVGTATPFAENYNSTHESCDISINLPGYEQYNIEYNILHSYRQSAADDVGIHVGQANGFFLNGTIREFI